MQVQGAELNAELEQLSLLNGADYFGVADLSRAKDFIREQGGAYVDGYPYAVSVGVRLPDSVVEPLGAEKPDAVANVNYDHYIYKVVNSILDRITVLIAKRLDNLNYRALPVAASLKIPGQYYKGNISHKLAANLAGLGWIGKSCLLVTPEAGPRVRWGTVLTDAPLKAGEPLENGCKDCHLCIDVCPANALKGRSFDPNEPRRMRIDVQKCDDYRMSLKEKYGVRTCGKCLWVCPYGRKRQN